MPLDFFWFIEIICIASNLPEACIHSTCARVKIAFLRCRCCCPAGGHKAFACKISGHVLGICKKRTLGCNTIAAVEIIFLIADGCPLGCHITGRRIKVTGILLAVCQPACCHIALSSIGIIEVAFTLAVLCPAFYLNSCRGIEVILLSVQSKPTFYFLSIFVVIGLPAFCFKTILGCRLYIRYSCVYSRSGCKNIKIKKVPKVSIFCLIFAYIPSFDR